MQLKKLTHYGKEIFKGTAESCFIKLLRSQSQSTMYAIAYDGWKIERIQCSESETEEILKSDPWYHIPCELLQDVSLTSQYVKVKVISTGEIKKGDKNAMLYSDTTTGSLVKISQSFLFNI